MNNQAAQMSLNGIAVIGMVGRFPGAKNVSEFWQNLCAGQETIAQFSDTELIAAGIDLSWFQQPNYVKAGAVLEDIDQFDAAFFEVSPREAELMDPQHRLFLESAWEALEHAGYDSETYKSWIGVYAGGNISTYLLDNLLSQRDKLASQFAQILLSHDKDYVSTRVSYKLNLKGPSINVSTACSTSLVAVHLACRGLMNYECDMALAGGVSVNVPHTTGYFYQKEGIVSPDGHCRAFDAKAQGTVIGNGVGVVVLKRLKEALADGDSIYAVIKGSAINNDGANKVGFTAPSVDGQAKVIAEAQVVSRIDPATVTYIESHGTGTALGDPIEFRALKKTFSAVQSRGSCAIGSVKTNVGHLNSAAGVTSLIKTVMALHHKQLPPSLHFEQPNPEIDFANSPFYVNTQLADWRANGAPRRAGVSSFGFGGTNAHVVLEEAPSLPASSPSRPWQVLLLSAKTPSALDAMTANLAHHLQQHPDLNLADIAYTLQIGRRTFPHRRMLVCQDRDDAIAAIDSFDPQRVATHQWQPGDRPIVFLFPGQGAQYIQMAHELYAQESIFRDWVDRASTLLMPHLELDLRQILYPQADAVELANQKLQQTAITQSALFVIEYALAQLWQSWGIRPTAMMGHSIGEYVAATLAGVFTLEDALAVVAMRGRLMQQLPVGGMVAVPLAVKDVQPLLNKALSLAAVNAPSACVVSGESAAIAQFQTQLQAQGVECRLLHTSHAFHSQMMEPILETFATQVRRIKRQSPQIPFISNLTGTWITPEEAIDPHYWSQHLRQTVQFATGVTTLLQRSRAIFLEVGPGRTLSTLIKRQLQPESRPLILTSLRHPQESRSDFNSVLTALGQLWLVGSRIDWSSFYQQERRYRIPLPTYPFERQRYWLEKDKSQKSVPVDPSRKSEMADWFYLPSWKRSLLPKPTPLPVDQRWLVFIDQLGIGPQIVKQLTQQGIDVIAIQPDTRFAQLDEQTYTIAPDSLDHYIALFDQLKSHEKLPQNIAFFWGVTTDNRPPDSYIEFNSLLTLLQAMGKQRWRDRLNLWVMANQMQAIKGGDRLHPEKATLLGLCHVIPQEYSFITCRIIDMALPQANTWQAQILIDQLLNEFAATSMDHVVAYRDRDRWVQGFEPVHLESVSGKQLPVRQHGVYLITDGLDGKGAQLATVLAQIVHAKLIILEEEFLPSPQDEDQWLATHDEKDVISRKIHQRRNLQALGAEVLVIHVDWKDPESLHQLLTPERIGVIHGVIHAVLKTNNAVFCTIQELTATEQTQQLQAPCRRLAQLENLLPERTLDFCLVISSIASVLGGFGLAAYSAAHQFADTLVARHNQMHIQAWMVINWDRLQPEISQTEESQWQRARADLDITPTENLELFQRVLGLNQGTQVLVSTTDLATRYDRTFHPAPAQPAAKSAASRYARPSLDRPYSAPTNPLEQNIAEMWQEVLGIQTVGVHDHFFELGGDSLIATQLASRLQATFPVELPLRDLILQILTVAKQAETIEALLIEKIELLSEAEVEALLASSS